MKIAFSGLGRMGIGLSRRLKEKGHEVFGFDRNQHCTKEASSYGVKCFGTYKDMFEAFGDDRRVLWIMVPQSAVDDVINEALPYLKEGDLIIDGGNSYYKDSIRRYNTLKEKSIKFLDIGTSGGVWGYERGFSLMVGGDKEDFDFISPILKDLANEGVGFGYMGGPGMGHFVKMVHNAVEYGMMESIAEGLDLIKTSKPEVDLKEAVRVWTKGSVVASWLMDLTYKALCDFGLLEEIKPYVEDTGEGRWSVIEAVNEGVAMPSISNALFMRFRSREQESFRDRVLAALRYEFGQHKFKKDE